MSIGWCEVSLPSTERERKASSCGARLLQICWSIWWLVRWNKTKTKAPWILFAVCRKEGKKRGRGRCSSWPAGERLDYCCKKGVSQQKQPLASWQCPFRAPTPQLAPFSASLSSFPQSPHPHPSSDLTSGKSHLLPLWLLPHLHSLCLLELLLPWNTNPKAIYNVATIDDTS